MRKRYLGVAISLVAAMSLCACGNDGGTVEAQSRVMPTIGQAQPYVQTQAATKQTQTQTQSQSQSQTQKQTETKAPATGDTVTVKGDGCSYKIPQGWTTTEYEGYTVAYNANFAGGVRDNIIVATQFVGPAYTLKDYAEMCELEYNVKDGYKCLSTTNAKVGKYDALMLEVKCDIYTTTSYIHQYLILDKSYVYVVTYTFGSDTPKADQDVAKNIIDSLVIE